MQARIQGTPWWFRYPIQQDYWLLHIILLAATLLRFNNLNSPGLWLDEVYYTIIAQQPILNQIIHPVETVSRLYGNDPILSAIPFSLALKLGDSNYLARFPAALFGILSVAVLYKLGRLLFGNTVGLTAALLLTFSNFDILYSQEARSYAQLSLFSLAGFWFFYKSVTQSKIIHRMAYALLMWAGVSSNYAMLFIIPVQTTFLAILSLIIVLKKSRPLTAVFTTWGYFLSALALVFLMRLPWFGALHYSVANNSVGGAPTLNLWADIHLFLTTVTSGYGWLAVFFLLSGLAGLLAALWQRRIPALLLICWLGLSLPATIISVWLVGHFFHPRFAIWVMPAMFLAVACGLVGLTHFVSRGIPGDLSFSTLRVQVIVLMIFIAPLLLANVAELQQASHNKQTLPRGQLQEAVNFITSTAKPGEYIITISLPTSHAQFYVERSRQDLIYLDETAFAQQQAGRNLPQQLAGRWYVIHHNAYVAPNIPPQWNDNLHFGRFHDIVVVYQPESCTIQSCIEEAEALLTAISRANPQSVLAETINNILAGLARLEY
jgi:4-amino-4-deoxy-L-arabinose transferase-like glycosyltransferase